MPASVITDQSLTDAAFRAFCVLAMHSGGDAEQCRTSQRRCGELLGYSARAFRKHVADLAERGLIDKERTGRANIYTVNGLLPSGTQGADQSGTPSSDQSGTRRSARPVDKPVDNSVDNSKAVSQKFRSDRNSKFRSNRISLTDSPLKPPQGGRKSELAAGSRKRAMRERRRPPASLSPQELAAWENPENE